MASIDMFPRHKLLRTFSLPDSSFYEEEVSKTFTFGQFLRPHTNIQEVIYLANFMASAKFPKLGFLRKYLCFFGCGCFRKFFMASLKLSRRESFVKYSWHNRTRGQKLYPSKKILGFKY